jgi:hypothetical protein
MAKSRKRTESASVLDNPALSPESTSSRATGAPAANDDDGRNRRDRVAMRAYELYLSRGGSDGGDFDDWLAAEREIGRGEDTAPEGDSGE